MLSKGERGLTLGDVDRSLFLPSSPLSASSTLSQQSLSKTAVLGLLETDMFAATIDSRKLTANSFTGRSPTTYWLAC